MTKIAKSTICLRYEGDAMKAARFYAKTFPDSSLRAVNRARSDFPQRPALPAAADTERWPARPSPARINRHTGKQMS